MTRRLKSLFFILVLCGGVFSGTSFADNNMKKDSCPMKCCEKIDKSAKPQPTDTANLCRTINCTNPAPISTVNSTQTNLAPLLVILKNFTIFQFLLAPQPKDNSQPSFAKTTQLKTFQPKYIQHQSFLI